MRSRNRGLIPLFFLLAAVAGVKAQPAWYYQYTVLPQKYTDLIAGESSGEQAYNSIVKLSDYNRLRSTDEFKNGLFEFAFIKEQLGKAGFANILTENLGTASAWNPLEAVLYETEPVYSKLISAADLPFCVIPGSSDCDITAPLVWIGQPNGKTLDGMDLKGKIVLTSAREYSVRNMLLQKEVAGVISFTSSGINPESRIIADQKGYGIRKASTSSYFAFNIPFRDGDHLRSRILAGEKIKIRAIVKSHNRETALNVVSTVIPGSEKESGEIIVSAHLFEGYGNQGANDNSSGSAAILEAAVTLKRLIDSGSLPSPRRTIRFIWVPEFSGTIPWTEKNRSIINSALCNINLDMVGLALARYGSYFVLHRTTMGNAHYVNDVVENFYRYTGETNQVNSVVSADEFTRRIVAPSGSADPFYYQVEAYSGGSDHVVFNDPGIRVPGIMMITWPDPYYHTSADRFDKTDPTQLKRAVFIAAASAYAIATAGHEEAIDLAGEIYGNGLRRIGYQVAKSYSEISNCGADRLAAQTDRSESNILGSVAGEIRTLRSLFELSPEDLELKELVSGYEKSLNDMADGIVKNLRQTAMLRSEAFGLNWTQKTPSPESKLAASIIPLPVSSKDLYGMGALRKLISERTPVKSSGQSTLTSSVADEAFMIADGKSNILQIKNMLDAQFQKETTVSALLDYFALLKEAGLVKY